MHEFWFTFATGGVITAPIFWGIGRYGLAGFADRVVDVLADGSPLGLGAHLDERDARDAELAATVAAHPANMPPCPSGVTVLGPVDR